MPESDFIQQALMRLCHSTCIREVSSTVVKYTVFMLPIDKYIYIYMMIIILLPLGGSIKRYKHRNDTAEDDYITVGFQKNMQTQSNVSFPDEEVQDLPSF